jgi:hypothetical protein
MECKDKLGWIGVALSAIPMTKDGKVHISRAHMCTLCYIFRVTTTQCSPYDGAPGKIIEAKFYSFGMYRRGGRSQVTMRREGCVRAASKAEIAEHGRWRTHNGGYEAMSEHYNESTLEDHIYITLLCM